MSLNGRKTFMLLSYVIPQLLLKTSSLYNRDIRVLLEKGQPKLLVNGSPQSGSYIRWLWNKALRSFLLPDKSTIQSILVLGVGGGTVIRLLSDRYPNASVLGIDIDPVMIDIAKNYFHLDEIPRLTLSVKDGEKAVSLCKKQGKHFDIIVIDLFSGRIIPEFVKSSVFLSELSSIKKKNGIILINYLQEYEYGEKSDALKLTLDSMFSDVRDYKIRNNRFFRVS